MCKAARVLEGKAMGNVLCVTDNKGSLPTGNMQQSTARRQFVKYMSDGPILEGLGLACAAWWQFYISSAHQHFAL